MGFNSDGSRISLPRGRVLFARKSAAGVLGPYLHLGNCSRFEFTTIGDTIAEVDDFTAPTAVTLKRVTSKRIPEFAVSLYEVNPDNLALALMGNPPSEYTQAATAIVDEVLQGGAKVGGIYQTAKIGPISAITLTSGATPFTVGTHYVVRDASLGVIEIIALPGGVVEGDPLAIDYTPTAYVAGSGFKRVLGGAAAAIEGKLLYLGTSSVGPREQLVIWNCSIESDGAFPLIGSDIAEFGLKVTVLSDAAQASPFEITEIDNGSGVPFA